LDLLTQVPHLRQLYVWQTDVTPAGIADLQQKKQKLQIITGIPVATTAVAPKPTAQTD
jgi:hypothetical protein